MTREDIIRMAREVGYGWSMTDMHAPALERFANLIAADERNRILEILDALHFDAAADIIREDADLEKPRREWQGLTDTEIHNLPYYQETRAIYRSARAIAAAMKEKNK